MKKLSRRLFLSCVWLMIFAIALSACGSTSGNSGSAGNSGSSDSPKSSGTEVIKVGNSLPFLSGEWFLEVDDSVRAHFSEDAGYSVTTVSCEGSAAQQVTDIENLIASGCKIIVIGSLDPSGTADVLKRARQEGIFVFDWGAGTLGDPEAYDARTTGDSVAMGRYNAEMASDWVNERYPDAEDGSIDAIVVTWRSTEDNSLRDDGMMELESINPKFNVVDVHDLPAAISDESVTEYIEMALDRYPTVKVFLLHDSSHAVIANEVIMRNAEMNPEEIGLFACGTTQDAFQLMKKSSNNESVLRGLISSGDIAACVYKGWEMYSNGELNDDNKVIVIETPKITLENLDEYIIE